LKKQAMSYTCIFGEILCCRLNSPFVFVAQLWNAAHNDEFSYHSHAHKQTTALGMTNTNWMWHHGAAEVRDSVDTVEGKVQKQSFA
jgi:hypothetical protein